MKNKTPSPKVRVVVEVDGNPIGVLDLDMGRLWPLIDHRLGDTVAADWIDQKRYQAMMRAAVMRRLTTHLQTHLYQTLGNEIVKAELDIESFAMKAEAAAQAFGRERKDIEKLTAKSETSIAAFQAFFWEYMMDERETIDPKKAWKAANRKL